MVGTVQFGITLIRFTFPVQEHLPEPRPNFVGIKVVIFNHVRNLPGFG